MDYTRTDWENLPNTDTPLNKNNLNNIEDGIEGLAGELEGVNDAITELTDNVDNKTTVESNVITTNATIAENTNYTIPSYYEVGADVLDIYYMGEKLVKGTHYIEVGENGSVSNTIQFYNWGQSVPSGRIIEFVVRGVYANES